MKKNCNLGLLILPVFIFFSFWWQVINTNVNMIKFLVIAIFFLFGVMIYKQKREQHILTCLLKEQKELYKSVLRHDIKTPILAEIRAIELLLGGNFGKLNKKQKEMLELTLNSCKHSYKIIRGQLYS